MDLYDPIEEDNAKPNDMYLDADWKKLKKKMLSAIC